MAIDTADKQFSMLFFVGHRKGHIYTITNPMSGADFQDFLGFYRGIAWSTAAITSLALEIFGKGPKYIFRDKGPKYMLFGRDPKYGFRKVK